MTVDIKKRIDIAAGRRKADLVLKNCRIINVFTEEIIEGDIAVSDGFIAGIGQYEGLKEVDVEGKYVSPGLIDGHVHIESAMVTPGQYARTVVPRGTTTVIADPHEIANVCGLDGIRYMIAESENVPLDVFVMLPSCVPATPFENSGAVLEAEDLAGLMDHPRVLGLGELMNYVGTAAADANILRKLQVAEGKIVDGHGPEISGYHLNAYVAAGIRTEHECTTVEEMAERLRLGMYILVREGSAARNLEALMKGASRSNMRRLLFCTDDRHPGDILKDGHIDNNVRLAIRQGTPAISAIRMASLNAAECYRLYDRGAIAPGYRADLLIVDSLHSFKVEKVFKDGVQVGELGKAMFQCESLADERVLNTVNFKPVGAGDLDIPLTTGFARVIKLISHSLVTESVIRKVETEQGMFKYHDKLDILKLAVIERHKATGNIGLGLVEGFGLKNGAIASTVAHDSHNLIVIGDTDRNILAAVDAVQNMGGGLVMVHDGAVVATLPLPIGGLMSDESLESVDEKLSAMLNSAYELLNVDSNFDPFMTLAFMALPVIPEIKLTDEGLFDVSKFEFTEIDITE